MAGGTQVEVQGYKFKMKPRSWVRFIFRDFIPYWQASRPEFVLTITNVGEGKAEEQGIDYVVRVSDGLETTSKLKVPALEEGGSISYTMGGLFLGRTGDYLITIPEDLVGSGKFKTVYSFHTTPRSWVFLAIAAGLLAGVFATLGNWLFVDCG